jgi:hypothetical protein
VLLVPREYDIHVPLNYNDGSAVEARRFQKLQAALLSHFTGLTVLPQPNKGFWKKRGVIFQDEIVIYRVISWKPGSSRRFLKQLRTTLESDFRQEKILIIERAVRAL